MPSRTPIICAGDANFGLATYIVFCGHNGNHSTEAVGAHDWNGEAMASMVNDLIVPWRSLRSKLQVQYTSTAGSINEVMEWAIQHLGKP